MISTVERDRRIHIHDQEPIPGLFPLGRLLRETCSAFAVSWSSTCLLHRCWGYGLAINALDDRWPPDGPLELAVSELAALMEAGAEGWFYDVQASVPAAGVSFGLLDSTLMYAEGPADGVAQIARAFVGVEWVRLP